MDMPRYVRVHMRRFRMPALDGTNCQTKGQVSYRRRTLRSRRKGKIRDLLPFKAACKRKAHASGEPKELAYTFSSAKFSQTRPTKCLDLDSFGGKGAIISSSGLADLVEDRAKVALRSLKAPPRTAGRVLCCVRTKPHVVLSQASQCLWC